MINEDSSERDRLAVHTLVVFRRAERKLASLEGEVMKAHGLTPAQFGVLDLLYAKGPMSVGQLTEKTLSTSGCMTVVIKNMTRDGLVRRVEDPRDKRRALISLTDAGRMKIAAVLPEHIAYIGELFEVLTAEEQRTLIRILKKFKHLRRRD